MSISDFNAPVSKKVMQIVEQLGIKQRAIAERAGFSNQQLNDMLNGRRLIKVSDIPRLAKALSVSPNELFSSLEEEKPDKVS